MAAATICCSSKEETKPEQPAEQTNPVYGSVEENGFNYIFRQGTYNFECYRIPSVTKSAKGTILAFAEARRLRSNGDSGDIDVVLKRSTDGGRTWNPQKTVWDDGNNTCGNPVPIAAADGTIHLLMSWNYEKDQWSTLVGGTSKDKRKVFYSKSTDDGETWSTPVEITSSIVPEGARWYATGPNHGIQIQNGPYKGRLISPDYFVVNRDGKNVSLSQISYSDDGGKTWKAGNPTSADGGECCVAERPDGSLVLFCRTSSSFHKWAVSTDGGVNWSELKENRSLLDPQCQGSILAAGQTLFSSNPAHASERLRLTIKKSTDGGESWSSGLQIYSGNSGYSDMVRISDQEIAVFSEIGEKRYTDGLSFKIINVKDIQ